MFIGPATAFIRPGCSGATRLRRFVADGSVVSTPKIASILELERALFAGGARRVIANSEMVKRQAQEFYGYPASQIDVVPNGVPLADFRPDPEVRQLRRKILRLRDDDIAVLFVGSGWERKGAALRRSRP